MGRFTSSWEARAETQLRERAREAAKQSNGKARLSLKAKASPSSPSYGGRRQAAATRWLHSESFHFGSSRAVAVVAVTAAGRAVTPWQPLRRCRHVINRCMSLSLDGDIHSCSRTSLLNCADYRGSHTGQGEWELPILHVQCPLRENVCFFNIAKKGSSFGSRVNEVSHMRDFVLFAPRTAPKPQVRGHWGRLLTCPLLIGRLCSGLSDEVVSHVREIVWSKESS